MVVRAFDTPACVRYGRFFDEERSARYRAAGYWTADTFAEFSQVCAEKYGDHEALVGADYTGAHCRLSYAHMHERVCALAAGLRDAGISEADVVVVQLPNTVDYVVVVLALFRIGAIPLFALPAHRSTEIGHFLRESEAKAYIVAGHHAGYDYRVLCDELDTEAMIFIADSDPGAYRSIAELYDSCGATNTGAAASPHPESLAFLQLSGGTTGTPKLIPRTHADYLYSIRESVKICGVTQDTRFLVVLPASHNFTMSSPGILGVLQAGGTVVMCPDPSPSTGFRLIERESITMTALVPPLAIVWIATYPRIGAHISSLQSLLVGGAKFVEESARTVAPVLGCRLRQVFGMAEGLVNYTRDEDSEELVVTTQGRPISPDDELRIVTLDGDPVSPGERGVLYTRGPYTISGYFHGVDAASFTDDGFYCTGDVVRQLPSGHLIVEGRVKDQVNRAGEKVSAEELENELIAHPSVLDAVVVGVPDSFLGERTCAYVLVAHPEAEDDASAADLSLETLREFLRARGVADYKLPDQVTIASEFPTTAVGKVSRKALRARLSAFLRDQKNV